MKQIYPFNRKKGLIFSTMYTFIISQFYLMLNTFWHQEKRKQECNLALL